MTDLDSLAVKAAVLKILNDRVADAFRKAKEDVAEILGPEGRKNAVFEGHKLASVSVSKGGRVSVDDERLLTAWVAENYPTEVEETIKVRPAFLEMIKKCSEEAGEPCGPGGQLDVPGIRVGDPFPLVRKAPGADEIIDRLWREQRLQIDGSLKELE